VKVILASASPRRKELLGQLGWDFSVQVSQVEEVITKTHPGEIVEELSSLKAKAVFEQTTGDVLVIGADTVVADKGNILGKPVDEADAANMLRSLQNSVHQVYTGVTLCLRKDDREEIRTFYERTEVKFYPMSEEEIKWYVDTREPMDKAGAYGIQGLAGRFVKGIKGDYNNVVGLPAARLYQEVKEWGLEL
jgi:septum formation protein